MLLLTGRYRRWHLLCRGASIVRQSSRSGSSRTRGIAARVGLSAAVDGAACLVHRLGHLPASHRSAAPAPLCLRSARDAELLEDATTDEQEQHGKGCWQRATVNVKDSHLFNYNDLESSFCEPGGRADASDASSDDDDPLASVLSLAHGCEGCELEKYAGMR